MSGRAGGPSPATMEELFERARRFMPGGVSSPVRAFRAVGGSPVFFEKGFGARLQDVRGRHYLDYVLSWGPLILGHAHPRLVRAIAEQVERGTSFGAPTELETALAERLCGRMPWIEKVRFVSSGTEATMSAIRLARAATGREGIVKMDGCYHGHADSLLVRAGSGVLTLSIPGSPGVPSALASLTRVVPYNDVDALAALLEAEGEGIACVILEPVAANMGVVPPAPGYLEAVRELTARHGVLLVLDEIVTGFRVHPAGAQALYGVRADLACYGKILGGGLPVGAYGGRADLMDQVAPEGPVYQAGTLAGNPLAMRAGIETLDALAEPGTYERLEALSARLEQGLAGAAREAGIPVTINRVGSMLTVFMTEGPVQDQASALRSDRRRYSAFFHGLLERGVYFPPSPFEAAFVSLAHTERDVDETVQAAREAFRAAARVSEGAGER